MSNILLRVTYDGSAYGGFQYQENAPTVQAALERALAVIYKQPLRIIAAGRTDAGVHARGQAANYHAPFRIDPSKLPHAINAALPSDIVVTGAEEVEEHFHARFAAHSKLYSYTIDRAPFPRVARRLYSYYEPGYLDLGLMRSAMARFKGTHDFKAFQAAGSRVVDTKRQLLQVELKELPGEELLIFYFEGDGFLYRMVRLISGTILRVGRKKLIPADVDKALLGEAPQAVGPALPARGLCLERVSYVKDS